MSFIQYNKDVDLDKYPKRSRCQGRLIVGDIHGNAQFLLFLLVKFGFLEITKEQYQRLIKIYQTPVDELTAKQIIAFRHILHKAKCRRKNDILLLGDVLSDRGNNDGFTVCLLRRLHRSNISYSILEGNHDFEFLESYENGGNYRNTYYTSTRIKRGQTSSIHNLQRLLEKDLRDEKGRFALSRKRFRDWVTYYLIDHYKALDYSLGETGIIIYSHAPIDIGIIAGIAKRLHVEFDDGSPVTLAQTIDRINVKFSSLLRRRKLSGKFHAMHTTRDKTSRHVDALTRLIWNRDYISLNRSSIHKGYHIGYCHGHDSKGDPDCGNVICLDKMLGKSQSHNKDELTLLIERRKSVAEYPENTALSFFNQLNGNPVETGEQRHEVQHTL
ncbi:metallophosphoesterase [Legionella spiritensis]|uniref:Substrate of the Dot/Icm secretion system n=1 Tax=Legionella spiritensis TaxID=452 RepID=A0A0W0YW29_LEGSP|nr:metallophosphoesterase [Legionella spiritensis]KTD61125.1 substrate of the Dot/Icm secretion system [Legionella spiritensis]SNV45056.1 Dot/Icm secretion system substrate [Legionella spiritensis]